MSKQSPTRSSDSNNRHLDSLLLTIDTILKVVRLDRFLMHQTVDIEGTVDLHSHCSPSPFPRRVDGYECAREAGEAGMDAVVLKEHFLPTIPQVPYIERLLGRDEIDIEPFGSVVLNYCNGGFNPFMVQSAINYGAQVIWAPTIDAKNHGEKHKGVGNYASLVGGEEDSLGDEYTDKEGLYALDGDGELLDEVKLCLDKIVTNDVALFIGHLSYAETLAMVEYVSDQGHDKVVIDHPNYFITDFSRSQQKELAALGAYLNFPFNAISPKYYWCPVDELYDNIIDVGVENCVVSSDVGQIGNPSAPEGIRMLGELLLEEGLSEAEFTILAEENPKGILNI